MCKDLLQRGLTLIWREGDTPRAASAYSTLTSAPLAVPFPPENEPKNEAASKTISENPDLFKVVIRIKADMFKKNLKDHPNQPFVKSIVRGSRMDFGHGQIPGTFRLPTGETFVPPFTSQHDAAAALHRSHQALPGISAFRYPHFYPTIHSRFTGICQPHIKLLEHRF